VIAKTRRSRITTNDNKKKLLRRVYYSLNFIGTYINAMIRFDIRRHEELPAEPLYFLKVSLISRDSP
jgi:hypothetical protein